MHFDIHNGIPAIIIIFHFLLNFVLEFHIFAEEIFIGFQKYLLFFFPKFYYRKIKNFGDFLGYG